MEMKVKTTKLEWYEMQQYVYMAIKESLPDVWDGDANKASAEAVTKIRHHLMGHPSLNDPHEGFESSPMHDGRWLNAINDAIKSSSLADGE